MSRAGFSKKPHWYTPKCRRHEKNPPRFLIRRLSPVETMDINEYLGMGEESFEIQENEKGETKAVPTKESGEGGKVKIRFKLLYSNIKSKFEALKKAISGWEHVEDEKGEPIPFKADHVECLDMDIVNELSGVINGDISEEEEKNSEPPSLSEIGSEMAE